MFRASKTFNSYFVCRATSDILNESLTEQIDVARRVASHCFFFNINNAAQYLNTVFGLTRTQKNTRSARIYEYTAVGGGEECYYFRTIILCGLGQVNQSDNVQAVRIMCVHDDRIIEEAIEEKSGLTRNDLLSTEIRLQHSFRTRRAHHHKPGARKFISIIEIFFKVNESVGVRTVFFFYNGPIARRRRRTLCEY